MQLATPVQPTTRRHQRLTVAAAAAAVLCVLLLPPLLGRLLGLVVPVDPAPAPDLTELARQVARLPGATVLEDTVVITVSPGMQAPTTAESERVLPSQSSGYLVPLGVSGLVPLTPEVAPAAMHDLAAELTTRDHVLANLGPLVVGCLPERHDPPQECTPVLLTRHATGYFRFPEQWGSSRFLEPGSAMEAQTFPVLGGHLVAGGLTGNAAARVDVLVDDGSTVTAFTTPSASPGDTVWWAVTAGSAVRADAYDDSGELLDRVHLVD